MYNSKLLKLIKAFDSKEIKQLAVFVACYNRVDSYSIVLLEHILKIAPNFESKQLNKKNVFKVIFPHRADYNDLVMRRCMSRLFQLCEQYIVYLNTKNHEHTRKVELLNFYEDRQLKQHFGNALQSWKKKSEKENLIDGFHFVYEFQTEKDLLVYNSVENNPVNKSQLEQTSYSLDSFFLMNKLKICCTSITYQTLSNTEYELPMMREVLDYLNTKYQDCPTIVQAYYFALLSLIEENEEIHFIKLKEILFESINDFHPENQRDLFSLSQNYCIKRINKGGKAYLNELLELYKIGLEKEVVLENGVLSPMDYKNIVTLGTRLKSFDWTEHFIETYTHKMEESFRESYYYYNMARLFFSKKEFEKVIDLLRQVEHREIFVDIDAKVLLLKTYYELEEIEAMISLVESFRMFLSRKKNIGYHKSRYQNFLKFFRSLNRLNLVNRNEREKFKEQVLNAQNLIEKDWFIAKLS